MPKHSQKKSQNTKAQELVRFKWIVGGAGGCVEKLSFTNLYVLKVLIHRSAFRYVVSFVEAEFQTEYVFIEPNLYKGIHESFVIVICHTTTILNLTYHVTNSTPGDPLKATRKHWL